MTNPTRREFVKISGGALAMVGAGGLGLMTSGCNVFTDIENWVPVGIATFNSLVTLLENAGVINPVAGAPITAAIGLVQAGFAQIVADVKAYQAIQPPPAGALAKIQAALQVVDSNFQAFLASINVSDNKLLQLVVGLAGIILSAIGGFINQLSGTSPVIGREYTVARQKISVTPKLYTVRAFKKAWNVAVSSGGHPEMEQHVSFWENF